MFDFIVFLLDVAGKNRNKSSCNDVDHASQLSDAVRSLAVSLNGADDPQPIFSGAFHV